MSAEESNKALLEELYGIWSGSKAGSADDFMAHIADDVTWRSLAEGAPGMEFSACRNCKSDVTRYFTELIQDWSMDFFDVERMVAQGDRVVVLSKAGWTNKQTGKSVVTPKADVFSIRNGKITEFFEYYDTAAALGATRAD